MLVVDVVIPVLHRPKNVAPLMESLWRTARGSVRPWFIVEHGDDKEKQAVLDAGAVPLIYSGTFPEKVNFAWNYIQQHAGGGSADWLMPIGDDVIFHEGWLEAALVAADKYGWDVVGTNDLLNPAVLSGHHATHPLIRTSYIADRGASWDGPGTVCSEQLLHCFVDTEWSTVAVERGVFGVALDSVVEHIHPFNGKAPDDEGYRKAYESFNQDAATYARRSNLYGS